MLDKDDFRGRQRFNQAHRKVMTNGKGPWCMPTASSRANAAICEEASNSSNCQSTISSTNSGVPLAACQVFYLGAQAPETGTTGLQAVQKPLLQLYGKNSRRFVDSSSSKLAQQPNENTSDSFISSVIKSGVQATLAVYSFGVKLIYSPDDDSPSVNIWFPISNLLVCAAIRSVNSLPPNRRFVPLDLPEADESGESPLFAAIFRQSRARHISECFCFICKTKQNAMDLVLACTTAFEDFVRHQPSSTHSPASGSNHNGGNLMEEGAYEVPNSDNDRQGKYSNGNADTEETEDWQPILVRRLWLPAPQMPCQVYYNQQLKGKPSLRPFNESNASHQALANTRFLSNPSYMRNGRGSIPSLLRYPSVDDVLIDSPRRKAVNCNADNHNIMSRSSLSLQDYKKQEKQRVNNQRTLIRQQSAGCKQNVSRYPGPIGNSRSSNGDAKTSLAKKMRGIFFSNSSTRKGYDKRLLGAAGRCKNHNNAIDYSTIASDEADLLRAQTECYGGGTLTRHPLPNEKAFLVSIKNQQHSSATEEISSASFVTKTATKIKNNNGVPKTTTRDRLILENRNVKPQAFFNNHRNDRI